MIRARGALLFADPGGARRVRSRGGARRRIASTAAAFGIALMLVLPATASAHPLGNFTINHFAAVRVSADRISLDVVIDRAEIPSFQEQQRLDTDADGVVSPAELSTQRESECRTLTADLHLAVGGTAVTPRLLAAGLTLPSGAGGLSTMRLVCELEAALGGGIPAGTTVSFEDRSFAERIGWREIVVLGDGVTIGSNGVASNANAAGVSNRLTSYPTDLLTQPLDERSISMTVTPGGPALPAWAAPDASALETAPARGGSASVLGAVSGTGLGAVPGGVGRDLAGLVDVQDLTPLAIIVSLAIAFGLGVIHALSPGHGKTIMAAYLVGSRGSSRQAIGLGLAVTVSHTLGVLALAGITLAASSVLPPERLYPVLGVASGALVIVIGGSLLWQRLRVLRAAAGHRRAHAHGPAHDHGHAHGQQHAHEHAHGHAHDHSPAGDSISWRGLLALGLSGGLVPSASALILLLGSIAAGRVAYGLVLVVGFGLGMAVVLAGIGLLLVKAQRLVERRMAAGAPSMDRLRRLVTPVQLATACLVVVLGVVLTEQALTQVL
ncbi:MAG TPA: high frequency lysogenization protein HflD [Patescibacteria group bacterium]|nr:high frequency lysogenization protein HflD [Patescibacteria group bacterium]